MEASKERLQKLLGIVTKLADEPIEFGPEDEIDEESFEESPNEQISEQRKARLFKLLSPTFKKQM